MSDKDQLSVSGAVDHILKTSTAFEHTRRLSADTFIGQYVLKLQDQKDEKDCTRFQLLQKVENDLELASAKGYTPLRVDHQLAVNDPVLIHWGEGWLVEGQFLSMEPTCLGWTEATVRVHVETIGADGQQRGPHTLPARLVSMKK